MSDGMDWAKTKARRTDPGTSHAAARAAPFLLAGHYRAITVALGRGDGTAEEIATRCALTTQQVHRRLDELLNAGWIELTGEERLASTRRYMRVFRLKPGPDVREGEI